MTWCLKLISGVADRYCYTRSSSAARVNRLQIATATAWRKGWDSNPRSRCNGTLDFESSALNRTQPPFLLTKRKHRTPNVEYPTPNATPFEIRCWALGVRSFLMPLKRLAIGTLSALQPRRTVDDQGELPGTIHRRG